MVPASRTLDAYLLGAFTLRLWAILFVIPHFTTIVIIQQNGVFQDILIGTGNNWLPWVQLGAVVGTLGIALGRLKAANKRQVQGVNQM